ncbi:MAG: hypothetical protein ABI606_01715 [Rhodoferax sp.]
MSCIKRASMCSTCGERRGFEWLPGAVANKRVSNEDEQGEMMARYFENPINAHREEINGLTSAGALLFGLFFFAYKGIWRHFIIQLLLVVIFFASFGAPGTMFAMVMWIAYAVMAQGIVAANYLRNGWRESGANLSPYPEPLVGSETVSVTPTSEEKTCPFCAELVKKAAIRCRHCGSDLTVASS